MVGAGEVTSKWESRCCNFPNLGDKGGDGGALLWSEAVGSNMGNYTLAIGVA